MEEFSTEEAEADRRVDEVTAVDATEPSFRFHTAPEHATTVARCSSRLRSSGSLSCSRAARAATRTVVPVAQHGWTDSEKQEVSEIR